MDDRLLEKPTLEPEAMLQRARAWPDLGFWLLLLALAAGDMGCSNQGGSAGSPAPALRVEYSGCETVLEGPVCVLAEDRRLRLWVGTDADARIEIRGAATLKATAEEVQQGLRYEVEIPSGAPRLTIRVERESAAAAWRLALREPRPDGWLPRSWSLFRRGDLDSAERLLKAQLAGPAAAAERGEALGLLARIERLTGRSDEARTHLASALDWHRQSGRTFNLVNDATVLVFLLLYEAQDFAGARKVLDALPVEWGGPAEASYYLGFYRGLLAKETGRLRSALRHLRAAARQAERLGLARLQQIAEHPLVVLLQRVGRYAEAEALTRRLWRDAAAELSGCERGQLLNNLAWAVLLAREAGEAAEDPTPLLEEALTIFSRDCTVLPSEQANVLLSLALAHLQAGRIEPARQAITQTVPLREQSEQRLELWRLDIDARLALAEERPERALRLFGELAERATAAASTEAEWRALVGAAQSFEALGQRDRALARLARAELLLDRRSLDVALHDGRATFVARHHAATRLYLDLLLARGRAAEALEVARRARSRVLRGLRRQDRLASLSDAAQESWDRAIRTYRTERRSLDAAAAEDWRLPADRLRRLEAERSEARRRALRALDAALAVLGEEALAAPPETLTPASLLLAYHPLPVGWAGFAAGRRGVAAERLSCVEEALTPQRQSACLLAPFAQQIEDAEEVRILPYGRLRVVDFHALAFAHDVLLASAPVIYAVDLGAGGVADRGQRHGSLRALVVADPRGDLPAARAEARTVLQLLRDREGSWETVLLQGDEASAAAVRRLLTEVDLFHFAGHATFSAADGWESGLPLAGGGELTVGDILALPRVPRWAVLSGCETGRGAAGAAVEDIGLANAFAAAGSDQILAAVRPVADRTAFALVRSFYREWSAETTASIALRRAQLALRREVPQADWSSFRLIEP